MFLHTAVAATAAARTRATGWAGSAPRPPPRGWRTRAGSRRAPCTRWAPSPAAAGCAAARLARAPPSPCPTPCDATPLGDRPITQTQPHYYTHIHFLLTSIKLVICSKLFTWNRTDRTTPQSSGPTMNCSPNIAIHKSSHARPVCVLRSRTTWNKRKTILETRINVLPRYRCQFFQCV